MPLSLAAQVLGAALGHSCLEQAVPVDCGFFLKDMCSHHSPDWSGRGGGRGGEHWGGSTGGGGIPLRTDV